MTSDERIQAEQMRAMQRAMSFDVAAFRRIKELLNPSDAPPEARAHVAEIGEKICNLLDGVRLKAQARWMSEVKRVRMQREAKIAKAVVVHPSSGATVSHTSIRSTDHGERNPTHDLE